MSAAPDISLPRFEGPLDLLLALVRQNQIAISDIPIAEVTAQYLDYMRRAEALDINLGAEFVYMAAMLIQMKSASLLARDPAMGECEEDPRQELVQQLLSYEELRSGAEFLRQKLEVAEATWSRPAMAEFEGPAPGVAVEMNGALNLLEVLRLAKQALAAARTYDLVTPTDAVSVEEMMGWLEARLSRSEESAEAGAMLAHQPDAAHRTSLFLAMLEMANSSRLSLEQDLCFGPIWIRRIENR